MPLGLGRRLGRGLGGFVSIISKIFLRDSNGYKLKDKDGLYLIPKIV